VIHPIFWVAVSFAVIFAIADNLLSRQASSYSISRPNDFVQRLLSDDPIEITPKGISISADRSGHYSGVGKKANADCSACMWLNVDGVSVLYAECSCTGFGWIGVGCDSLFFRL